MTASDRATRTAAHSESNSESATARMRRRSDLVWLVLAGVAFVAATFSFWSSNALVLDDYVACSTTERLGILGMARWYFFDFVGLYRPVTVPMLFGTGALCEVPIALKAIGLVLHLTGAGLAFRLARTGFGWHRVPAAMASLAILFSPVAMAGSGWVAAARGYALALVLVLWVTLRLVEGKRGWRTVLLGALAVMTQEQALFVVLLLPFILTPGSFWRRTRYAAVSALPIVAYFAVLLASPRFLPGAHRLGSDNGASINNIIVNFGAWSEQLRSYFPFGRIWSSLARGPFTPLVWITLGLIGMGVILFAWQDRPNPQEPDPESGKKHRAAVRTVAVALASLTAALLFILPLLLAPTPWATPRIMYLPLAAIAFFLAGLTETVVVLAGRLSLLLGAVLVVVWAFLVVPGVVRDASAMADTGRQEQAIANQIATAAMARDATIIILIDPPWSIAPDGTAAGDHMVQAFAVYWAAAPALYFLTDLDPERVIVVRDSSVCAYPGFVTDTNTGEQWSANTIVVYDFNVRSVVSEADTVTRFASCPSS